MDGEEKGKDSKAKKQILLRLSPTLWQALAQWAEDDFRSINGQIEYLLADSVKRRKRVSGDRSGEEPEEMPAGTSSVSASKPEEAKE